LSSEAIAIEADDSTGRGPTLVNPIAMVVLSDGSLAVVDEGTFAVLRVDPNTGDRTVVSDDGIGSGPAFAIARSSAVAADGRLMVIDEGLDAIVSVDLERGD
jgi:hypothetical protein